MREGDARNAATSNATVRKTRQEAALCPTKYLNIPTTPADAKTGLAFHKAHYARSG